jgi:RNA polymerase sigma-70 factor, ECF subfamily
MFFTVEAALASGFSLSPREAAENTLVVRAQAGETAAFDELVRAYRDRLYSVILNLTNQPEDASDLTQEVFIKAFTKIRHYSFQSSFYTWLYRIAMNEAFNHLRRARRKRMLRLEYFRRDDDDGSHADPLDNMADTSTHAPNAGRDELRGALDKALEKLSDEHRAVVVLSEIEGFSLSEVAEVVGASEGTVKSRLHYAKKELQKLLTPYLNA